MHWEFMEGVANPDGRGEMFLKSVLLREGKSFVKQHQQYIEKLKHIKE